MAQEQELELAVQKLIDGYTNKITGFNIDDFLKTGVDPFRFTVNVSIWGLKKSVKKEIEHKVEMALENLVGDFHEDYLGNALHLPSQTRWEKIQEGRIPGVDIANYTQEIYLQIKSKHNSMNSSSSARLAQELSHLSQSKPNATVGCVWVVATQSKKAIGENIIAEVAACYKGKKSYGVVTGDDDEISSVLQSLLTIIPRAIDGKDFESLLDEAAERVSNSLQILSESDGKSVIEIVTERSID